MEGSTLQEAAEEEEAVDDAKSYAGRLGVHRAAALDEGANRLLRTASRTFEGWAAKKPNAPGDPTKEPEDPDAQEGWGELAARLARRKEAAASLGPPRDPRVAMSAVELHEDDEDTLQPIPTFYVVKSPRGVLRLHRADGCWAATAVSFREFEALYGNQVAPEKYTHYCRRCWPHEGPAAQADSTSDESSSSSS